MEACAWPVLPVAERLRLVVAREMPVLPAALDAAVEGHWRAAQAGRRLFNGRVFSADRIGTAEGGATVIEGHWTEYRRVVAQMADAGLVAVLGVRSLAVCGVVTGPDGVAVGRREARSAYQAGLWQLPPAGSVDGGVATAEGADWEQALLNELREELGIGAAAVRGMRALCLVQHPSGVLDLGVRIDTGLDAAAITAAQRGAADQEYDRLFVAPAAAVPGRVAALGGTLVPPAMAFLARAAG